MAPAYNKTIHLVGAQRSNHPWGIENRLIPAFESIGCRVLSTDFRQQRAELPQLLNQAADLVLVCKGDNIPPALIRSTPCLTALWYAENVGTPEAVDEPTQARRRELAFNVAAFDFVFTHDQANIEIYRGLGARRVSWLPCVAVNPEVQRKLQVAKKYDVVFVGSPTPYRQRQLSELRARGVRVEAPNLWDPAELNRVFNESRIVLNVHLSEIPNTETRVGEVLGAGSFLLSERLSSSDLLQEGETYASWPSGDVDALAQKIRYFLTHEKEREAIAARGHAYAHQHLTFRRLVTALLEQIDFNHLKRIWPSYGLGILFNSTGEPTLRLDDYYGAVDRALAQPPTS